ncbi:MAG: tetraacyldisaccharide 4'-kinase [Thiohalocapsa sp.]|nr:tetraacyldisaccharide 4'-kinase [Thiohalocapsa sp.]
MRPEALWYGRAPAARAVSALLSPLGWLYCAVAALRAAGYRRGLLHSRAVGVPVIVVGNLTVGGTGKTPLVLWLAEHLRGQGFAPGIATRGFGAAANAIPQLLPHASGGSQHADDPAHFGDEPLLLAARAGCPVAIGRDRVAAARLLVERGCDVVITDDGLQHYRLRRDCEILVIDGERGFGNGRCLPAGPLREPRARAPRADLQVINRAKPGVDGVDGFGMALMPEDASSLYDPYRRMPLADFAAVQVTAVAGIGNPERFFAMLRRHGIAIRPMPYPDHHRFSASDLAGWPEGPVLMTEKDAVKCRRLPGADDCWSVPVSAVPDAALVEALDRIIADRVHRAG